MFQANTVALPNLRTARKARRGRLPRCAGDFVKQDKVPTLKSVASATVTEYDPCAPSAVNLWDAVLSGPLFHLEGPTMMTGCSSWLYEPGSTGVNMPLVPLTTVDILGFAPSVLTSFGYAGARAPQRDRTIDQKDIVDDKCTGVEHHDLSGRSAVQRSLDRG